MSQFDSKVKTKTKTVKTTIWNGRKFTKIQARLVPFLDWTMRYPKGVWLMNKGKRWWLYYEKNHQTGSFRTKMDAIIFYARGGG